MIAAVQGHEPRPRNRGRDEPAFGEGHPQVALGVEDQGWRPHLRGDAAHVDPVERLEHPGRVLRRRRDPLQLVEPVDLLPVGVGNEQCREDLTERRMILAPSDADHVEHQLPLFHLFRGEPAVQPSAQVAAVQNEMADPLGVTDRERDGDRRALADAEERKSLQLERVGHPLQVPDPGLHRHLAGRPVGQAASALVVADQGVIPAELAEPVAPDRAVPVELEVVEPVGGFDQGRATAHGREGDARAVRGGAEADGLSWKIHTPSR